MSNTPVSVLPDIQRTLDTRDVFIKRVGVTGIRLPIRVLRAPSSVDGKTPALTVLDTVGEFELACSLSAEVKGTHMSRFTQVLNQHILADGTFSSLDLQTVALQLAEKLETRRVFLQVTVDYFMSQEAPVTKCAGTAPLKGILQIECVRTPEDRFAFVTHTGVEVQGKTCCPCSREISDFNAATGMGKGAHAQRSKISVLVQHEPDKVVWFEMLVHAAWRAFSHPIYPVLKRPDERAVTMGAYDNPKFVEDVVRDMACQLRQMPTVKHFTVRVDNAESIHYHDAYAELSE